MSSASHHNRRRSSTREVGSAVRSLVGHIDTIRVVAPCAPDIVSLSILGFLGIAFLDVAVPRALCVVLHKAVVDGNGIFGSTIELHHGALTRGVVIAYIDSRRCVNIGKRRDGIALVVGVIQRRIVRIGHGHRRTDSLRHLQRFRLVDRGKSSGALRSVIAHDDVLVHLHTIELAFGTSVLYLLVLIMQAHVERGIAGWIQTSVLRLQSFLVQHEPFYRITTITIDVQRLCCCNLELIGYITEEESLHIGRRRGVVGLIRKMQVGLIFNTCQRNGVRLYSRQHPSRKRNILNLDVVGVWMTKDSFCSCLGTNKKPLVCLLASMRIKSSRHLIGFRRRHTDGLVSLRSHSDTLVGLRVRVCILAVIHQTVLHLEVVGNATVNSDHFALAVRHRC